MGILTCLLGSCERKRSSVYECLCSLCAESAKTGSSVLNLTSSGMLAPQAFLTLTFFGHTTSFYRTAHLRFALMQRCAFRCRGH